MTHVNPQINQQTHRPRNDDGSESAATWIDVAGADWSQELDTNFRVRFLVQETAGGTLNNQSFEIRFSHNGGAYTVVGSGLAVVNSSSIHFTDGDPSTQQIGAGTFVAGNILSTGASTNISFSGNDETEIEWCLQLNSAVVSTGDTINLRVYFSGGTVLDAYTDTPTITAQGDITVAVNNASESDAANTITPDLSSIGVANETNAANTIVGVTDKNAFVGFVEFTLNTSTGPQDITIADLGGHKPNLAFIYAIGTTTQDASATHARFSQAITDGVNTKLSAFSVESGVTTQFGVGGNFNDGTLIGICDLFSVGTSFAASASFTEFISNGIRINVDATDGNAYRCVAVFLYDRDFESQHVTKQGEIAVDPQTVTHTFGAECDFIISTAVNESSYGNALSASTGGAHEFGIGYHGAPGVTSINSGIGLEVDFTSVVTWEGALGGLFEGIARSEIDNYDADSFERDIVNGSTGSATFYAYWLIRAPHIATNAVTLNHLNSDSGNKALTGAGFPPRLMMALNGGEIVATFGPTTTPGITIGFADGTNQAALGIQDTEGASTTAATSYHHGSAVQFAHQADPTQNYEYDVISLDANGATVNTIDAPANAKGSRLLYFGYRSHAFETDVANTITPALSQAGLTETVNNVSETDSANALTVKTTRLVANAAETDAANALTASKAKAIANAAETDTASAISAIATVAVASATETDNANVLAVLKLLGIAASTETDAATSVTAAKLETVASSTETDAANTLTSAKLAAIANTSETDAANAITSAKTQSVSSTSETDTANAIQVATGVTVNAASESDAANALASSKLLAINSTAETDSASGITSAKLEAITSSAETDSANVINAIRLVLTNNATETDAANTLTSAKLEAVAASAETDSANAIQPSFGVVVSTSAETDNANALTNAKLATLAASTETDAANAIQASFGVVVSTSTETDAASAVASAKLATLAASTETDNAQSLTASKAKQIAAGTESDAANNVTSAKTATVSAGAETDAANVVIPDLQGGLTVGVGNATETSIANVLAAARAYAVATANEVDAAQNHATAKALSIGTGAETDAAEVLTREKLAAIGDATEADNANVTGRVKTAGIGTGVENDNATGIGRFKFLELVAAQETDSATNILTTGYVIHIEISLALRNSITTEVAARNIITTTQQLVNDIDIEVTD